MVSKVKYYLIRSIYNLYIKTIHKVPCGAHSPAELGHTQDLARYRSQDTKTKTQRQHIIHRDRDRLGCWYLGNKKGGVSPPV